MLECFSVSHSLLSGAGCWLRRLRTPSQVKGRQLCCGANVRRDRYGCFRRDFTNKHEPAEPYSSCRQQHVAGSIIQRGHRTIARDLSAPGARPKSPCEQMYRSCVYNKADGKVSMQVPKAGSAGASSVVGAGKGVRCGCSIGRVRENGLRREKMMTLALRLSMPAGSGTRQSNEAGPAAGPEHWNAVATHEHVRRAA
jgi:hypothetical protein